MMRSQKNISPLKPWLSILAAVMVMGMTLPMKAQPVKVYVPAGSFHSILPEVKGEAIQVEAFYLDETAVTNEEFLRFLSKEENKSWRLSEIPSVFGSKDYLQHWEADLDPDFETNGKQRPVTNVSWYAANAFCSSVGGRLPTLNEWEYSAQLLEFESLQAMNEFSAELIGWYSSVDANNVKEVGSTGIENELGVKDQFGLIMEWVENFKPLIANDLSLDCGTVGRMQKIGSVYSYASSIRYITRMSYSPNTSVGMMGFRCAYDAEQNTDHSDRIENRETR